MAWIGDKFAAVNKIGAGAGLEAAQVALEAVEELTRLNLEAGKALLKEAVGGVQTLGSGKDFAAVAQWWNAQAMGAADRVLGYSRNVYEISAKASAEIGELVEQRLLDTNQEVLEWVDETLKSSPVGQSEATASAAKLAMANARTVIEEISKAAKQAAGFADANVRAAATATAEAVKGAAK